MFSASAAPSLLIDLFEENVEIEHLPNFTSGDASKFYRVPPITETVTFVRKPSVVPKRYGDVVPFMAGKALNWQVEEVI